MSSLRIKLLKLLRGCPHKLTLSQARVDRGANSICFWDKSVFTCLKKKNLASSLHGDEAAIPTKGIGCACIVFNSSSSLHVLAPSHWAPEADVNTVSTGALKLHSNFQKASHEAFEHLQIVDHQHD